MEGGLKEKTARGLLWGALNSGSTQLLNLIFGIILGRLLTPAEYGIVGVLSILTPSPVSCSMRSYSYRLRSLRSSFISLAW